MAHGPQDIAGAMTAALTRVFLDSTVMLQQRLKFGVISENALVRDCATAEDQ